MGLLEDLLKIGTLAVTAKSRNRQRFYDAGFEDGRSGNPRHIFPDYTEWIVECAEYYERGYEDGLKQQLLDKL